MSPHVRLLLVGPDAEARAAALAATAGLPPLDVTPAASATAARAHLSGTPFDAVATADAALAADLAALRDALGGTFPVEVVGPAEALAGWIRATFGLPDAPAADPAGAHPAPSPPAHAFAAAPPAAEFSGADTLAALGADLARVAHDLGSPLAVVSGNAQLGRELARAFGADPQIAEAFEQIEQGAAEMAARLRQLAALRTRLAALAGGGAEGAP